MTPDPLCGDLVAGVGIKNLAQSIHHIHLGDALASIDLLDCPHYSLGDAGRPTVYWCSLCEFECGFGERQISE